MDDAARAILTTNVSVQDFRYIAIGFQEEDAAIILFEDEILYESDEFTPLKPLVISCMEQGSIPQRGIAYTDETGSPRYFYITMSGEDGSLLLVEFDLY